MMFTTVHLHPVVERLSRNEGGGGCLPLVDIYLIFYVVCSRMFSCCLPLIYIFCCSLAAIHFRMLFVGTNLIFANFSWNMVPM